jgi:predicted GNAT family acetyltransferase
MNANSQYRLHGLLMGAAKKTQHLQTPRWATGKRLRLHDGDTACDCALFQTKKFPASARLPHVHRVCCDALIPGREAVCSRKGERLRELLLVEVPKVKVTITREDKPTGGRYVARVAGKPDAEMTFSKAGEKILIIDHTGVPDELGGMGVGKALVEHMVMDVRERGLKVVPLCPFTKAMLQRHKEWQDILKDPF